MEYQEGVCLALTPLEIISGKWKPIILYHLFREGTKRFGELQKLIPEITKRMLTLQLRELEVQDIINRVVYPQVPPKVEYSITEYGKTLEPLLEMMHKWGDFHLKHLEITNSPVPFLYIQGVSCKALTTIATIVGKWKPIILYHLLHSGTKRFSELQKLIPEITKRMLTLQLRDLEDQDMIIRVVYPQVPPKVEYSLTEYGKSFEPILQKMHEWGNNHLKHMESKNKQILSINSK